MSVIGLPLVTPPPPLEPLPPPPPPAPPPEPPPPEPPPPPPPPAARAAPAANRKAVERAVTARRRVEDRFKDMLSLPCMDVGKTHGEGNYSPAGCTGSPAVGRRTLLQKIGLTSLTLRLPAV
ncbi:hypothetical protein C5L14_05185 [Labrys okinawensis]|uniref:Uncharacterized protein n=1 Tax=Labrys okinawensis TaxID=346911 RepID=A0A2S9QH08_9HYPH|nr:hypothetical protein C5L14_05185 [Labrys okinawensis]